MVSLNMSALLTSPYKKYKSLEADDQFYLEFTRHLVFAPIKAEIEKFFNKLDADGSGQLDADDFKDDFAATAELKKRMYRIILDKFDFNDDKSISLTEFYDGFLLMTWLDADIEFHRQQLLNSNTLGNMFHDWVLNFNLALETQIKKLGHELDHADFIPLPDEEGKKQGVSRISHLMEYPNLRHPLEVELEDRKRARGSLIK